MFENLFLVAAGFVLLFVGGEGLVRGAVAIAERLGISKLLIGLIVVGFGTSMPELLVSVNAALNGAPEIALGNVVGSNIANVLLILGVAAVTAPILRWQRTAVREAFVAVLVSLLAFALVHGAVITRMEGIAMLVALAGYLIASYWLERWDPETKAFQHEAEAFEGILIARPRLAPFLALGGIAALIFGADLLVEGAVSIARDFGVPDSVIGLSLVAAGTSLPELATALVAAIRRESDVVLGNVIGSTIFNILAVLGVTVVIHPIEVDTRFGELDTPVMLGASVLLLALLCARKTIGRLWGTAMLAAYAGYMVFLFSNGLAA